MQSSVWSLAISSIFSKYKVAHILIEWIILLHRSEFGNQLDNGQLPCSNDAQEERRRKLMYELNTSGKYFAFKEQLKVSSTNRQADDPSK